MIIFQDRVAQETHSLCWPGIRSEEDTSLAGESLCQIHLVIHPMLSRLHHQEANAWGRRPTLRPDLGGGRHTSEPIAGPTFALPSAA